MTNETKPYNESQPAPIEVVTLSALEQMERAQLDIQINTAKAYPRRMSVVKKDMLDLATLDTETAAGCFYTLRRKSSSGDKVIQGPSARLAEIAMNAFGNIHGVSRIIANDGKTITAQAVCHDLEKNVRIGVEVKRRITDRDGRTYSEDMQVVTGNAACSIALRNAAFKVIPMALVKPVYEAAKKAATGDTKTLSDRRKSAMDAFKKMGVSPERVFSALGVSGMEDIGLKELEILIGMHTAINDGDQTIHEAFPESVEKAPVFEEPKRRRTKPADASVAAPAPVGEAASHKVGLVEALLGANVAYDDFRDFIRTQGLLGNIDDYPGYDDLPPSFCEKLAKDTVNLSKLIRIYGKTS